MTYLFIKHYAVKVKFFTYIFHVPPPTLPRLLCHNWSEHIHFLVNKLYLIMMGHVIKIGQLKKN